MAELKTEMGSVTALAAEARDHARRVVAGWPGVDADDARELLAALGILDAPASTRGLESWHGTENGYRYHGCRCDRCREGHTARCRRYREQRRVREAGGAL